ncbi:cupin domain-containing protein [Bacillus sp. Marseille-P3661]|uniref:cupin domain-containing protein n=1 Tax=Bacillus sp. Marseille-P3661 TaxID=1936234 RepID=UPI000C855D08|nr:cupin domain-containing protein [Bacillus sp. Marseille-P3661]
MKKQNINDYLDFSSEKFTKRIIFKEEESTVFVLNFEPGQSLPSHKHPGTNVYLLVLLGEGTFIINGENIPAKKDEVIVCNGDEDFAFNNDSSSKVSLYVMLNKIPDDRYAQNI